MVALSLDLKPEMVRPMVRQQQDSLDFSMSTQQNFTSVAQLDLNELVIPSLANISSDFAQISSDFAQTIASQVDVLPLSAEMTPLRFIANEFLATQVTAVVTDRIAEALEIIVGMERDNAARDTERSWQEMYGLAAVPNSPAVTRAQQTESEYASQLEASLAA
jgi:hypothetical protein